MMLAAALAAGLAQAGAAQPAQEIRALDAEEASAMLAADLAALDRIWAPDSVVNAPDNAVKEKSQVLAAVRDGRIRYSGFERTVERVDVRGDVAISNGGRGRGAEGRPARRGTAPDASLHARVASERRTLGAGGASRERGAARVGVTG
jgi:hypothetical protein